MAISIWKENYQIIKELNRYSTSYITYVENGGRVSDYTDILTNKIISLSIKLKENRDYVSQVCEDAIPTEKNEVNDAIALLNGTYQNGRLYDILDKINNNVYV